MQPEIHINYLAVVAAMLAQMFLGFLWYGPLFGKPWAKEMKMPPDFKPTPAQLAKACSSTAWPGKTAPGSCFSSTPPIISWPCRRWG